MTQNNDPTNLLDDANKNDIANEESTACSSENIIPLDSTTTESDSKTQLEADEVTVDDEIKVNAASPELETEAAPLPDGVSTEQEIINLEPTNEPVLDTQEPLTQVTEELAILREQLDQINHQLAIDRKALRQRDDTLTRLHQDLMDARAGIDAKLLMPVFGEIVRVVDQMSQHLQRIECGGTTDGSKVDALKVIKEYQEMLVVALDNCGLTQLSELELETIKAKGYTPREMKIVSAVDTDNSDLDRQVKRIVSPGYIYNDKLVFPTKIDVFRFKQKIQGAE